MVERCNDAELAGERLEQIIGRVGNNETDLTEAQHERFEAGCDFLGKSYRHDALMRLEDDRVP
jgi:redox-regulated HSP33 family molecular chaperone